MCPTSTLSLNHPSPQGRGNSFPLCPQLSTVDEHRESGQGAAGPTAFPSAALRDGSAVWPEGQGRPALWGADRGARAVGARSSAVPCRAGTRGAAAVGADARRGGRAAIKAAAAAAGRQHHGELPGAGAVRRGGRAAAERPRARIDPAAPRPRPGTARRRRRLPGEGAGAAGAGNGRGAAAGRARSDGGSVVSRQIEALQEVLEKLKSKRGPHYEKKFGQVPMVGVPTGRVGTGPGRQ